MNRRRTNSLNDNICPMMVVFMCKEIEYKPEFLMEFGDYIKTYDLKVKSNSMNARMALYYIVPYCKCG
jgi:hypothetical protein